MPLRGGRTPPREDAHITFGKVSASRRPGLQECDGHGDAADGLILSARRTACRQKAPDGAWRSGCVPFWGVVALTTREKRPGRIGSVRGSPVSGAKDWPVKGRMRQTAVVKTARWCVTPKDECRRPGGDGEYRSASGRRRNSSPATPTMTGGAAGDANCGRGIPGKKRQPAGAMAERARQVLPQRGRVLAASAAAAANHTVGASAWSTRIRLLLRWIRSIPVPAPLLNVSMHDVQAKRIRRFLTDTLQLGPGIG